MRNYKNANAVPLIDTPRDDIYVGVTRKHAANMALASLLHCFAFIAMCSILYLAIRNWFVLFALSFPFTMYMYAEYLIRFTNEARDILFEQYTHKPEIIMQQTEQGEVDKSYTVIPSPNGKDRIILHIGLTVSQLEQIRDTVLKTKTLTVNYLESLGLSRQSAERLRVELTQNGLLDMDNKGRVHLTKNGRRSFERI